MSTPYVRTNRVVGRLGRLVRTVQLTDKRDHTVKERCLEHAGAVARAASRIQVFPTDVDGSEDPEIISARDAIRNATCVCFLGFGYHKANIARLDLRNLLPKKRVFGTVMGMLPNEMHHVRTDLGLTQKLPRGSDPEAAEDDCLKYLRRFDVL